MSLQRQGTWLKFFGVGKGNQINYGQIEELLKDVIANGAPDIREYFRNVCCLDNQAPAHLVAEGEFKLTRVRINMLGITYPVQLKPFQEDGIA